MCVTTIECVVFKPKSVNSCVLDCLNLSPKTASNSSSLLELLSELQQTENVEHKNVDMTVKSAKTGQI